MSDVTEPTWTHQHWCPHCAMYWIHEARNCLCSVKLECPRLVFRPAAEEDARSMDALHKAQDRRTYGY